MENAETFKETEDWRLSKLKEYGQEAYRPFVELLLQYQDAFVPYLRSLSRALHSGAEGLTGERVRLTSTEVDHLVSALFQDSASGVDEIIKFLEEKNVGAISTFLKSMSDKKPTLAFSTSYVVGLILGRVTKHIIAETKSAKGTRSEIQSTPLQGQIH